MEEIIREREEHGEYKDFNDFVWRANAQALNKRCIESLIKGGAFDCFGRTRSQLMSIFSIMVDRCLERRKSAMNGQMNLFGDILEDSKLIEENEYPHINEFVNNIKLQYEKEIAGTYLSGHPLDSYMDIIKNFTFNSSFLPSTSMDDDEISELGMVDGLLEDEELYNGLQNGDSVTCGGIITGIRPLQTKNGSKMAFLSIEDLTGTYDAVLFNREYEKYRDMLQNDALIAIKGRFTLREGQAPSIKVESIELLDNSDKQNADNSTPLEEVEVVKPKKLWLKYNLNDGIIHEAVKKILSSYAGKDEVFVKDIASNKAFKMNCLVSIRESLIYELETILDKSNILIKD